MSKTLEKNYNGRKKAMKKPYKKEASALRAITVRKAIEKRNYQFDCAPKKYIAFWMHKY